METKKTNATVEEVKNEVVDATKVEDTTQQVTVDATKADATKGKDAEVENTPILVDLKSYIGKDNDEIVRALIARSDCRNHTNLVITNVLQSTTQEGGLTIVVNKALPQYILDADTGEYVMSTTRNVFTSIIAISAILKAQGEMLLAKAIMNDNINQILAILKGARISVISHAIAAGEDFVNPFATRMPSEFTATERDRVQYFPYDVTLADKSVIMEELTLAKLLG